MSGSRVNAAGVLRTSIATTLSRGDTCLEDEVVALFEAYRDRLMRYLLSLGLPAADGEEIIQEVFLSLFQHLRQGKPRDNLRGWLFRVAHNVALKKRDRLRRSPELEWDPAVTEGLAIDPSPNAEAELIRGQTRRQLQAVLEALPEQDRQCLVLRAEGLPYREIAAVLDMSLGAVSISLSRSLARMARVAER